MSLRHINFTTIACNLAICSEINHFFDVEYCGKRQIESGSALSVLLSTTIFVIIVVKICYGLTLLRLVSPQHFDHCDDVYRCR